MTYRSNAVGMAAGDAMLELLEDGRILRANDEMLYVPDGVIQALKR